MMYHDNPRKSVADDWRPAKLTRDVCRDRARLFVQHGKRPVDMEDFRNWCVPLGYYLDRALVYRGPVTVSSIAAFLRESLRRH